RPVAFATSQGDEDDAPTTAANPLSLHDALPIDQWSFTATQGDYIALSMGEVAPVSGGFQPWIRLVSPTGVLLGTSIGASAVQIDATSDLQARDPVVGGPIHGFGRNKDAGSYLLTLAKG